jgi:SAM-dependent methyltransferase
MSRETLSSTDLAWEEWGRRDPYFGVITNPKFRLSELTAAARREFFLSGEVHVHYVLQFIRRHVDAGFAAKRVLDFGCGVGRTLVGFAAQAEQVVGLDVSPSMLLEARRNCDEHKRDNVQLLLSDDTLSLLKGEYDLIHSCIVFQHIPVARGRVIFSRLLSFLRPGGIGALQLTYAKTQFADSHGVAPTAATAAHPSSLCASDTAPRVAPLDVGKDPEMQMNSYHMNEMLFVLQRSGVQRIHAEFTDHGGELGVFLFFEKPDQSSERGPA